MTQVIGQSFHESAPTDAIYLVQVSLEEIVESRPVDLVYVPLLETFELGRAIPERVAVKKKRESKKKRRGGGREKIRRVHSYLTGDGSSTSSFMLDPEEKSRRFARALAS